MKCRLFPLFPLLSGLCGLFVLPVAEAAGFTIVSTQTRLLDGSYKMSAKLGFELSTEVNEAIQNGIPVTLNIDVEVLRKREFFWPQSVLFKRHQFRLQYHALSEQYLVKNLGSGEHTFYKALEDALYNLENLDDLHVIKPEQLQRRKDYTVRIRTGVHIKDLPGPLRFFAYFSPGWNLNSGWFSSPLTANNAAQEQV